MTKRKLRREDYSVRWVSALPVELAAAQPMLDEERQHGQDPTIPTSTPSTESADIMLLLPACRLAKWEQTQPQWCS